MNITQENLEASAAVVRIKVTPEDYISNFEKEIKKIAKTASIKGFRPGTIPKSVVQRMYGKSILFDELNKIVTSSLQNYLQDNKMHVLGDPLPQPLNTFEADFEAPREYEFAFDLGLAPEFTFQVPSTAIPYYEIAIDQSRVDQYINEMLTRYGNFINPEKSDEECMLYGKFQELDETGNAKEGGLNGEARLMIRTIKDVESKGRFIGVEKGASIVFNPKKAFESDVELSSFLNLKPTEVGNVNSDFLVTVDTIGKTEKGELNQQFYDKVYGEGIINSEEEFRTRINDEFTRAYKQESDRKLKHDIEDVMLDELNLQLPDEFLKRWIQATSKDPLTEEQLETQYPSYARGIKLRLIENKIMQEQNLQITDEEIHAMAKDTLMNQFAQYGMTRGFDDMEPIVKRYLEKQENVNKTIEALQEFKSFMYVQNVIAKDLKGVSYDEFVKIIEEHHH